MEEEPVDYVFDALIHRLPNNEAEATAVLARIQAHDALLSENPASFIPPCCPSCQASGVLRIHELRRRGFWYVVAHEVIRVASLVLRVACSVCGARTTVLPEFALPHKRYVLPEVVDACDRYLLDPAATYESAAGVGGRPVFHDAGGSARARSTVHRWVGFLGSLVHLLAHATELAVQSEVSFSPLDEMVEFAPHRYRSATRREQLGNARRWLGVRALLVRIAGHDPFPRFATAAAWR